MQTSSPIPHKFKIKLIGKSFVGKTSFVKALNNIQYDAPHEKTNIPTNYKVNYYYKYKNEIFYFEEEPEVNFSYINNIGVSPPFFAKTTKEKVHYIALFFIYDVTEKESLDYVVNSLKTIYSNNNYSNIMKVIISNKNDVDEKLKQVKSEEVQKIVKKYNTQFFEISCKDSKQINDTIFKVYKKMKDIVKINEYFHGIERGKIEFIEKEKLMPNYYEICIIGTKDSGKDCLKNKFLYDCCEKNVNLYDFCIPRTININGKEIKFDINIKKDEKNDNDFNSEFYYKTINDMDPNCICIIITYDVSNDSSLEKLKKITQEIFDSSFIYRKCILILGMKCDLLQENEIADKIKEGRNLAGLLNAHYYLVSNRTGFNVDTIFNDILVQAYNKYHPNDLIPTNNYYKESSSSDLELYNNIHVRNEKPKMKEKDKKRVEKQIEKELASFKKMKIQREQMINNKKKKENDLYANQQKEILKLNYSKIFRCPKCWKIPIVEINELNRTIITKCVHNGKNEIQKYKINEFLGAKSSIIENSNCSICKGNNSNHLYSFDYCINCQKIFCKKCESNHKNCQGNNNLKNSKNESNNKRIVVPLYLMDSYCYTHDSPSKYYCEDCKSYSCETCFEKEHKKHHLKYFKKEIIELLIKDKKRHIETEKACYKFVQKCFNDCMKSLQKKFDELMDIKTKILNIKENLVKDLELFKNNYNLVENVANLQFDELKFLKFNSYDDWKNKLNIIFEYLDEPLYIKNTNICIKQNIGKPFNILDELKKQSKENKAKEAEKEKEKEKKKGKEEKDKENEEKEKDKEIGKEKIMEKRNSIQSESEDLDSNLKIGFLMSESKNNSILDCSMNIEGNTDDILITDICALSSKYFGISSDDGLLKIYNAYSYRNKTINTIKEYLPNKGIYSLYKPNKGLHSNYNSLYLVGYETIKKLIFNNEYTEYKINEQYTINNCYYINIIELLNIKGILISTLQQEILSVVNDNNKNLIKIDLTYMIQDLKADKEIVSIDEISANKFNVRLKDEESKQEKEIEEKLEKERLRRKTIGNKLRKIENNNIEENKIKNKKQVYNILIELDQEETGKIILKNKYEFYKNFDILGKINSYQLLLVDKNYEISPTLIHLFDFNTNTFTKRFYIQQNIPVLYHKIESWVQNDVMFLFLDNTLNLTQYIFENEVIKELKPLFSLDLNEIVVKKNKDDNIILLNVGDKIFLFANNGIIFRINN